MKRYIYLFMLAVVAMATACKADPDAINNTPEVFVDEAGDLLRTSAVLTGHIMVPGNAPIKEYGFLVSPTSDFSGAETQTIRCDEGFNEFATQVTGLEIDHSYFYAAYASNGRERILSTVRAFTTPTRSGVLLTDLRLEDEKRATLSARVSDTGGGKINAVGLCWAADKTPTTYDKMILTELNADNTFTASLTGLEAGKTYYVRAFADSDILGDGTTQTISYSRDVVEIRLEEELPEPEPTWMLSGSLQGGENEIYFVEDSERGMFVAEDVNLTLKCRFKVCQVEDRGVAYGYADQTRTTHNMVDARLPLDLNGEDIEPTHAGVFDIWFDLDGKYLYIMSDDKLPEEADDYEPKTEPTGPASNEIWYTSTDENIVEPYDATVFGANIVSNTYENGQGVILFDGQITSIGDYAFWGCTGLTSVTIPDSVTWIGGWAFENCTGLTSITIPNSVTEIGGYAFYDCTSLTSVTIPDSVTSINPYTFAGCTGLTSLTIPDSVTEIGWDAFAGCTGLTSITIPDSVTSIGEGVFSNCSGLTAFYGKFASSDNRCLIVENGTLKAFAPAGLTSYSIPDSVTEIGRWAFADCTGLTSITIPDSVTSIGGSAFSGCTGLTSITIPNSVTSIGGYAFSNCTGLTSVYCKPTTPPTGESDMFYSNASGRKIYVPNASVDAYKAAEYWSDYADSIFPMDPVEDEVPETWKIYYTTTDGEIISSFSNPSGLNLVSNSYENGRGVITFDGVITEISGSFMYGEKTLKSIVLPGAVTRIGSSAFEMCTALESVTLPEGVAVIRQMAFASTALRELILPESVTEIDNQAFHNCSSLESVTLSGSPEVRYDAFRGCSSISSVHITSLEAWCKCYFGGFSYQTSSLSNPCSYGATLYLNGAPVTEVTIPQGVTSLSDGAFAGCGSLLQVTIPEHVTEIGSFSFHTCTNLKAIYCLSATPATPEPESFWNLAGNLYLWYPFGNQAEGRKIYVPYASLETYRTAWLWSQYADDIYPMGPVEDMPETWKIYYTTTDGEIISTNSILSGLNIVSNTYENGQGVIALDGPVTSIDGYAFYGCTSLTSITIPNSVTSIEYAAFSECTGLTSITIPDSVTLIEDYAFSDCTGLTNVTIPDSVTEIGGGAFSSCTGLTAFYGKFTSSDNRCLIVEDGTLKAFAPAGLTSYSIPNSVTNIGSSAFEGCTSLTSITIPNSVTEIGGYAFRFCTGLTSITIPNSVTEIEDDAFSNCTGLTNVTIPDSVTLIGEAAFYRCTSLTSVTIGNGVTSIGNYTFAYCDGLTSVYCKPTTPPTGESNMFYSNASGRKIYVPNASVGAYKAAEYWSDYASDIVGYDF